MEKFIYLQPYEQVYMNHTFHTPTEAKMIMGPEKLALSKHGTVAAA
jgi:hypothetical protein